MFSKPLRISSKLKIVCIALSVFTCSASVGHEGMPADAMPGKPITSLRCGNEEMAQGNTVENVNIRGIPAVVRRPQKVTQRPILLWHGFGAPASPTELMNALPLDAVPAVKVYVWLPLFGPRAAPGGREELVRRQTEDYVSLVFAPAVMGAARELAEIVEGLRSNHCMGPANDVDLFGFSAGGSSVLYALTRHNVRVHAAMIVNTPPNLDSTISALERATGRKYVPSASSTQIADSADALKNAQAIASGKSPASLLILQGADDAVVRPEGAGALEQALRPYYHATDRDSRLKLVVIPGMTHMWTQPPNAEIVLQQAAVWFGGRKEQ